ncbi:efflux RND transporter permease subunit [Niveispirillum sp.]|uniref:efflux RND transporter permease subunit n=1 Tax=Niveispirillum sp. TaxID=1917217 RepID=UPI001B685E63|nr:efflux RND transporter permease subunit [Niveispirillum sp.]MBP7338875.1 efflux RND transporter permease subunit [Niveispirillum sp.]
MTLGISGLLTRATIRSPLTPLFLMASLIAGLIALAIIPREEEPQISVPMVDIMVSADGLKAPDAAELVTKPLEAIVKGINGVDHVYSQTEDDRVMVTARFKVGTNEDDAIVRVHAKIRAHLSEIPVGIPEPAIIGRGINDVAIVTLTLSAEPGMEDRWHDRDLGTLAEKLRTELIKVPDIGATFLAGRVTEQVRVEPDPEKLALYGITLEQLTAKIAGANRSFVAGRLLDGGQSLTVAAGQTLSGVPDIGLLLLTSRDNRPVYVRDVAKIVLDSAPVDQAAWTMVKDDKGAWMRSPAVTVALAKRAGANAVVVADAILERVESLRGRLIPDGVRVEVTRNYGETASEKADELLFHLGLATLSIVALIWFAIGRREALVTLVVIPVTILMTLFAAHLMGYTINRVSLFALIFAIGILVDDAIVVVENIARHWAMQDGRDRLTGAVEAVAEVGNPTIVATLTVIAALLPMLFVSGMMGPYMAPIPVNASAAMLFSFFAAMVLAPWLMLKLTGKGGDAGAGHQGAHDGGAMGRLYRRVAVPILSSRRNAGRFLAIVGVATVASLGLFATKSVTVKLLPFDNKSELSVQVNLPRGATLQDTERLLFQAAEIAAGLPELRSAQIYAGTAAPFNFNGLVRHSFLRNSPDLGELQINLAPKGERARASHDIALDLRAKLLTGLKLPEGTSLKVVEVPPGPPVMATLLAEIYGPDAATRRAVAAEVRTLFATIPFITDIDDSYGTTQPRLRISIDQERLEYFGVEQAAVYDALRSILGTNPVGYSHRGEERYPVDISIALPRQDRAWTARLASTPVPANAIPGSNRVVELGELVRVTREEGSPVLFRRDGYFTDMVTAELAGRYEAPVYGMGAVADAIEAHDWGRLPKPVVRLAGQPADESHPTLLWDGEWEVTWVTFRDMGGAFGVAILAIYVLVVAQFRSFKLPLVILTPIPLTLLGIMLGHWIMGAAFTATSMIGFIALAGIIVRNSILLVDFIRHGRGRGMSLREVLLEAGAVRFKPILLTALSAMIGAATILTDPIFQGLAVSLLFGLASSTLLTVLVIPAIYVVLRDADAVA